MPRKSISIANKRKAEDALVPEESDEDPNLKRVKKTLPPPSEDTQEVLIAELNQKFKKISLSPRPSTSKTTPLNKSAQKRSNKKQAKKFIDSEPSNSELQSDSFSPPPKTPAKTSDQAPTANPEETPSRSIRTRTATKTLIHKSYFDKLQHDDSDSPNENLKKRKSPQMTPSRRKSIKPAPKILKKYESTAAISAAENSRNEANSQISSSGKKKTRSSKNQPEETKTNEILPQETKSMDYATLEIQNQKPEKTGRADEESQYLPDDSKSIQ